MQAFARRVNGGLRRLAYASPLYSAALGRRAPRDLLLVPPDPWPGDAQAGGALIEGVFRLAGHTVAGDAPPWQSAAGGQGFLEALHGFDWLRDLRAAGGDQARRQARRLIEQWIAHHDRWHPLVWRPDVLGLRVANWLGAHDFFCLSADDAFRARVFTSLARQMRHLFRVAADEPHDIRLVHTAKGLVYGGVALPEGAARLDLARRMLARSLPRQVLADGGHVQRNPSLQLAVLRHLVDIRAALRAARAEVPDALHHAIDRMGPALRFFRHGDGGLALFNGGQEGEPVLIDTALSQADARGRPLKSARHSGFERVMAGRTLLIVDVGGPPPPGVDDGAHAGLTSFELSVGRERMIVNCGSWPGRGDREDDAWHAALRGTPAHSTLCVAGRDSAEIVAAGGIGRRPAEIAVERQETAEAVLIDARHDGYRETCGLLHRRRLQLNAAGDELRGEDILAATDGRGHGLPFAIRFHLHPAVQLSPLQGGDSVLIRLPGGEGWRLRAVGGHLAVEDSVYVGRGEARRRTAQAVIWGEAEARPTGVQWTLRRERRPG